MQRPSKGPILKDVPTREGLNFSPRNCVLKMAFKEKAGGSSPRWRGRHEWRDLVIHDAGRTAHRRPVKRTGPGALSACVDGCVNVIRCCMGEYASGPHTVFGSTSGQRQSMTAHGWLMPCAVKAGALWNLPPVQSTGGALWRACARRRRRFPLSPLCGAQRSWQKATRPGLMGGGRWSERRPG